MGIWNVGNGNNGNITATFTAPNGTTIPNLTITPEPSSPDPYPPPTLNFALEPTHDKGCYDCAVGTFTITQEGPTRVTNIGAVVRQFQMN
ncbi:MAG: hypothetical protein WA667_21405 [Candidatus Nitrosopolaris sp.]